MASFTSRIGRSFMAGVTAFREEYLSSGEDNISEFMSKSGRAFRYALLWAYFESNVYDKVNDFAKVYKANYALYRYTRAIYNPSTRLGTFWRSHLMGGLLDPEAGDGSSTPSALPIITDNEALRPAIAQLWQWSNWQSRKGLWTLQGAVMGDCVLQVTDDVARNKVYLEVVNPTIISDITLDPFGNVKGYVIEYDRPDDASAIRTVTYRETCERGAGDDVIFTTYKNNVPHAWDGRDQSQWVEAYGFVPMVFHNHVNIGGPYGWSELYPALAKMRELDDLASKVSDHARISVHPSWLFNFKKPGKAANETAAAPAETDVRPKAGREEIPSLYVDKDSARGQALVADLNYDGVLSHIGNLLEGLENDYPELSYDKLRLSGTASGEALRAARQPAEAKVTERRAEYDAALVSAQQMAIAIGGMRGIFPGFSLDSYAAGALDHNIGSRPVFATSTIDEIEEQSRFWSVVNQMLSTGASLTSALRKMGWDEERITTFTGDMVETTEEEDEEQPRQ